MPSKVRQFHTRIDAELLDRFQNACTSRNKQASEVVREFMRDYVLEWEAEVRRGCSEVELIRRIASLEAQLRRTKVEE
ncbi:hypothetical protein [Alloalcanivorax xenomutans]|uniref:Uncharacterized protein n=1 Tax=Alloalcanivorax xenomutans TaxID=1094342 RepID=A0A9Q3W8Y7_9GAMM|nr:hypothetical protein [Alloalcanivorax xenomutans]MCE7511284.1 hypothetical protein [Alloalcanivorax xenomutans]